MNTDKIRQYVTLRAELTNFGRKIFKYLKENHLGLLEFGKYSAFDHVTVKEDSLRVVYFDRGYDIYETEGFDIPLDRLDDGKWQEYIDNLALKHWDKKTAEQKKGEEEKREKELQLLQELKQKYE